MTATLWAFLPPDDQADISAFLIEGNGQVRRTGAISEMTAKDADLCVAVIPGIDVATAALPLPQGTTVQMEAAAQLLLGDIVAQSDGPRRVAVAAAAQGDGTRLAAQFDPAICEDAIGRLADNGLDPDVIVPAASLLPQPVQGCVRASYFGLDIARTANRAFAAEADVMDYILEAEQHCERLDEGALEAAFKDAAKRPAPLNLRVGTLAKADANAFAPRWLKRSAILLAIAAVLWPAISLVDAIRYERATAQVDAQTMARVRAALPDAPRIVNARAQLNERMAFLGLQGGADQLLAQLANALAAQPGTTAESLVFAPEQGLSATLIIADQNRLDQLVASLAQAGVSAQAQPIRVTRDGPRAQIVLKAAR